MAKYGLKALGTAAALAVAAMVLADGPAAAQHLRPGVQRGLSAPAAGSSSTLATPQAGPAASAPAAPLASRRDPDAVRSVLKSVHGFSREALDAASTDVPDILQGFIDSAGEPLLVRRQAIKALALYPSDANLSFIEARVDAAPVGLRRLYLLSATAFGTARPAAVSAILERALGDDDVTVRGAAVAGAARLVHVSSVRSALEGRLDSEPDPALRREIGKALGRQ